MKHTKTYTKEKEAGVPYQDAVHTMTYTNYEISTQHGVQRAKERRSLKNSRAIEKQFILALERGKTADDFSSWERNYLATKAHDDCTAVAYNDFCYIFNSAGACVTLTPLPDWFGKKKHFAGKERIRNYKKHAKMFAGLIEQTERA